tara:strand:- start:377 stop:634 length:258 start_codon:yes stop_codon:yes gene_type:complete
MLLSFGVACKYLLISLKQFKMKNLKIETEFQAIPAIGFVIGYDDDGGLIIMLPFVCITFKRIKKKRNLEPVSLRHRDYKVNENIL